jgi:integrase
MKATFKFYLGREKNNGHVPIYFQVICSRQKKCFNLQIDTKPDNIVFKNSIPQIKKTDCEFLHKNRVIDQAYEKALKIRQKYSYGGMPLTVGEFTRCFDNESFGTESFYEYAEKKKKELAGIRSEATIQFYYKQISKLKTFRPVLLFADVTMDFMQCYQAYMINELHNKENTWNKSLEFVKRIMNKAFDDEMTPINPVKRQVIRRVKGNGQHLTKEEINKLEEKYQDPNLNKKLRPVLQYFLFACYTGLRYRDVKDLRFINIKNKDGSKWLNFEQHKTKKANLIPIIPQASNLLTAHGFDQQRVFRVLSNQPLNRYLKDIIKETGIDKHITFHSARRTCSNLLLATGVPLEVRCMIIGDTREVITGHYTAEDEGLKMLYMSKLSEALEIH